MNITKHNFKDCLPLVKDSIEHADFFAIDTELTGLGTDGAFHPFQTMSEYYSKIQENCSRFLIIQFGISAFKYHPEQKKYTHRDFNFYIFPKPHINRQAPNPIFTCQTSSIHFLDSNGFDFNKTIREGISYLNPTQEEKIKDYLKNKHKYEKENLTSESNGTEPSQKSVSITEEYKDFVEKIINQVDSFMSDNSETVIHLEHCSSFCRKLIYQTVKKKYPNGIEMTSNTNEKNETSITIIKATDEERFERLQLKQIEDMDALDSAIGFRKVLDLLSQSKKLVLGHYMLLDIFHTINQFFCPIPESLDEYKQLVKCVFPHLLDTKNIASSDKFKDLINNTHLPELLKAVQGKSFGLPTVEVEEGFEGYGLNDDKLHEAGYDAFICGLCYIGLSSKLGAMQSPPMDYVPTTSKVLSPYINRMYIAGHFDIPHMKLNGPDPEPSRENVFYVNFPREWKTVDIIELFQPYGPVYVHWLNDVSALVALKNPNQVVNAKNVLVKHINNRYSVRTFSDYQKFNKRSKYPAAREEKSQEHSHIDSPIPIKRRASGSLDSASNRSIQPIPEDDENEAEKVDDSVSTSFEANDLSRNSQASSSEPKTKKKKYSHDDNETAEVSSTEKVFAEENVW